MRRPAALVLVVAILPPPNKRSLSVKAIVCCLLLFLIHSGCATSGNLPGRVPTPPPSEERASFGTVGVVQAYYLPKTDIDVVVKGRLKGAGVGAVAALVVVSPVLAGGSPTNSEEGSILGATFLAAASIGANIGAIMATPKEEAVSLERLVKEIPERTSPRREYEDGIRKLALAIVNWNFPGETGMEWPTYIIVLPEK